MVPSPPVLRLGRLVVQGGKFAYEPGAARFEAAAGRDAEFALLYHFEEASRDEEHLRVRLTVDLGGKRLGACQAEVHDTPLLKDVVKGSLTLLAPMSAKGTVQGLAVIEASYATGSWGNDPKEARALREAHRFEVRAL